MKINTTILFLFFPLLIYSQEVNQVKDSISINRDNTYIENHNTQLNVKFDVTNEKINYLIPINGKEADITTNLNTSFGFVFSYKFFSIRLGVRPKLSESEKNNKGETDLFRFNIKLLFSHWSHRLGYNYHRGYYIENTEDFTEFENNSDFRIQFPHLTTNVFSGTSQYKFNKKYSVKAVEANTEIQLRSTGTFMPGMDYTIYSVRGSETIKNENGELLTRDKYNDYNGVVLVLNAGYYYTFVLHKYWFANVYANPGIGIDFYKTTFNEGNQSEKQSNDKSFFSFQSGASTGYNGRKYYFGVEFNYKSNSGNFSEDNFSLSPIRTNFHIYVGYRFKAPKQLSKPIDQLEDKMPILKKDNN